MIVAINDRPVEYNPDYPNDWKISGGDPYKFPVVINNISCFIKRFEKKSPQIISGWDLLNALKGKNIKGSPRVFDIKENIEKGKSVYYVFYKYFEGRTLDKVSSFRNEQDLLRLRDDLMTGYDTINSQNYWMSDFCAKNIFWDKDGNFLLLDLDSAQPFSLRPDIKMYGSKEYWIPVLEYYKKYLSKPNLKAEDLHGACLNYLQIFFLVLHYKLKLVFKNNQGGSKEYFDQLPGYLFSNAPEVKEVFIELLEKGGTPVSTTIDSIRIITNKIISLEKPVPPDEKNGKPVIIHFGSDKRRAGKGESFVLSWEVKDADRTELTRNGVKIKDGGPVETGMERNEFQDSAGDVTYELTAFKGDERTRSLPIIISFGSKKRIAPGVIIGIVAGVLVLGLVAYLIFFRHKNVFEIRQPIVYEDSTLTIDIKDNSQFVGKHIYFDNIEATSITQNGSQLIVVVPDINTETLPNTISITIKDAEGDNIFSQKAEFVQVSVKETKEKIVYENSALTLLGTNLRSRNLEIFFNNIPATIIFAFYDSIVVKVPVINVNNNEAVTIHAQKKGRVIWRSIAGRVREDVTDLSQFVQSGKWESGILVPFSIHSAVNDRVINTENRASIRNRNFSVAEIQNSIAENSSSLAAKEISVESIRRSLLDRRNSLFDRQVFVSKGALPYPGAEDDPRGSVRIDTRQAEDGNNYTVIRTHPRWANNGSIKGFLSNNSSPFDIKGRKRFACSAGFLMIPNECSSDGVNFNVIVHYNSEGKEVFKRIKSEHKGYTFRITELNAEFPSDVNDKFYIELRVDTGPSSVCDWAVWIQPQIIARQIVF